MQFIIFSHRNIPLIQFILAICCFVAYSAMAAAADFAFTANAHDYSVSTYTVDDSTGALRHLSHTPVPKMPSEVVVHPSAKFIYVVSKTPDTIAGFQFDSASGSLSPIPGSPFAAQARSPFAMAFHPSGRFAYVAARFAGVGAYRINEQTGVLTPLPGSPFKAQERTRSVVVHPSGQYVYATNGYSNSISAYEIDQQSGVLKELPNSPFLIANIGNIDYKAQYMEGVPDGAGGIPYHIALDPEGRFAYVANWAAASVSVMGIDKLTGNLQTVKGSPFFSGFNPYNVSVHPTGKFVYVAQWSSSEIMAHAVNETSGQLTPVVGAPFSSGAEGPVSVKFTADGRRAYVPHYESDDVTQFDVDLKTGAFDFVERVSTRLSPWSMAMVAGPKNVAAESQKLLVAGGDAGVSFVDVTRNAKATAMEKNAVDVPSKITALTGNHKKSIVYAVDKTNDKLLAYRVDSKRHRVTPIANAVIPTGKSPADIAIDANGWFIYVPNSSSNTLSVYYSDPDTGLAKPMRGPPVRTGKRPVSVALDPAARFVFVVNADSNTISVFRHFSGVEALTLESKKYGSPFATGKEPVELSVDPTGHFAYVANAGSNSISAYRINHNNGALSELPGSPFAAGKRPVSLVAHPNGDWLFVANEVSGDIVTYRIEGSLGALNRLKKSVSLSGKPRLGKIMLGKPTFFKPRQLRLNAAGDVLSVLSEDGRRLLSYSVDGELGQLTFVAEKQFVKPVFDLLL